MAREGAVRAIPGGCKPRQAKWEVYRRRLLGQRHDPRGLVIDWFAGGGGASTGIETALGRSPDVALNHDAFALAMHEANHPDTLHLNEDAFDADPVEVCSGLPVWLMWFSPDCKHFSKAKGGALRDRRIRGLAWVVLKWLGRGGAGFPRRGPCAPTVFFLENVEEFVTWGPLKNGKADRRRKGLYFRRFIAAIRAFGYEVEWKELRASLFGVPTIRKRLVLIARCDGKPIEWPEESHGAPEHPDVRSGRKEPWKTAADDVIDWSLPCHSIFLSREEGRKLGVKRPLEHATMARLARGVFRYVLTGEPFILNLTHQGGDRVESVFEPTRTLTGAHRGEKAVVVPFVTKFRNGATGQTVAAPLGTVTANSFIERPGGAPPLGVVTAFLSQAQQGGKNRQASGPVQTVTASRKDQNQLVSAFMLHMKGSARRDAPATEPLRTVEAGGTHAAQVYAFLMKYHGTGGQWAGLGKPSPTVDCKDRLGLVTVLISGEPYVIVDICMRMLTPRELFRAQGFPDSYIIDPVVEIERVTRNGRKTIRRKLNKSEQIRMCGNSVCPPLAAAVIRVNAGAPERFRRAA